MASSEPNLLRARLLEAEPVNPDRRRRLEQEITGMFEHRLSRGGRLYWTISLVAAAAFAALGAAVLARSETDGFLKIVWWVYTLANAGFVALAAAILRAGRLDVRRFLGWAKLSPALTLVVVSILFARAANDPSTEALLWVLFGIICLLVALAVTVYNRVVSAELAQREQMLRLELRVLELTERLGTDGAGGAGV